MTHNLKTWPGEWEAVATGKKKHELRQADHDFKVDDSLILREFMPYFAAEDGQPILDAEGHTTGQFTGRNLLRRISYITRGGSWGLPADLCILFLET